MFVAMVAWLLNYFFWGLIFLFLGEKVLTARNAKCTAVLYDLNIH